MKCPLCHNELRIIDTRNVIENDDTAEVQTKLFVEMDMSCVNKQCGNYNKIVDTVRNEQPIG